jgi:DNA adenine methylase
MDERLIAAVAKARGVLLQVAPELVEKTMWGSPAGKKRLAKRLAAMLPAHKAYTEPFAGSAAVLFAKEPVPTEAINDADPEIGEAYKIIQGLSDADVAKLGDLDWTGSPETWKKLKASSPGSPVEKLHRFLYLSHFAYGNLRGKSFNARRTGSESSGAGRVAKFAPRLKNVQISSGDYEPVVRKFDGKEALHFLDPPYTGYNAAVGEGDFDEQRFFNLVKGLKGKFLITYGVRGKLPKLLKAEGYPIKRIRTPRTLRSMRGVGGSKFLTQIVATNYDVAKKSLDDLALDGWELFEEETLTRTSVAVPMGGPVTSPPAPASAAKDAAEPPHAQAEESSAIQEADSAPHGDDAFAKIIPLIKGTDPTDERYVLGIVLEPETVDAQEDIYSSTEIRQAAHRFMEDFQDVGLMHKMRVTGAVKIVESYLAPADFSVADTWIKKGTWLLGVRVLSDALWKDVQEGRLTARRAEFLRAPRRRRRRER